MPFIHNFASTAGPLFHLLKNDVMFIWTEDCEDASETLKNALCTFLVLVYPIFSQHFNVQTDANLKAIGGVLSQVKEIF